MVGMLDQIVEKNIDKIKADFDKRLELMEKNLHGRFDRLEKKMDDMAAKAK